jgi:small neutral amino acid transporter SnatA (MarC family)
MSKILLFIFSIQPLLFCTYFGITLLNAYRVTEGISYLCVAALAVHYMLMGLKEIVNKTNKIY